MLEVHSVGRFETHCEVSELQVGDGLLFVWIEPLHFSGQQFVVLSIALTLL